MASEVSTTTQLLNVGVQCVNLVLFYFVFKKFFGDQIIAGVENKKAMIHKIKNAELEYETMINKAKDESHSIVNEALNHKKTIIEEANILAHKQSTELLATANRKADDIVTSAQASATKLEQDLKDNFESGVKSTTEIVVSKLIADKTELEKAYIDQLVKDVIKTHA